MDGTMKTIARVIPNIDQLIRGMNKLTESASGTATSMRFWLAVPLRGIMEIPLTVKTNKGNLAGNIFLINARTLWVKLANDGNIINRRYRDILA